MALKTLLLFITVILLDASATRMKTVSRQYETTQSSVYASVLDSTVGYSVCEKGAEDTESKCNIAKETLLFDDYVYEENCEIRLKSIKTDNDTLVSEIKVQLFGSNKSILYWTEIESKTLKANLILLVVSFVSCKTTERISIPMQVNSTNDDVLAVNHVNILTTENMFEVIFLNKKLCSKKWCKWTYTIHQKEQKVTKNRNWLPKTVLSDNPQIYHVQRYSEDSTYLVVVRNESYDTVSLITNDEQQILSEPVNKTEITTVSTANQMIGVCSVFETQTRAKSVNCTQFDFSGQPILEVNLTLGYAVKEMSIHNLAKGGFLLVTKKRENFERGYSFHATKIDASNERFKSLKISGLNCDSSAVEINKIFENKLHEYCLSLRCSDSEQIDIILHCFSDEMLSLSF